MLNLFLLAGQAHGNHVPFHSSNPSEPWWDVGWAATMPPTTAPRAVTDTHFEVKSCNRLVDNEPEMTLLISQDYFEENLRGVYDDDEFTFSEEYSYKGYVKTIPEDELLVDFDDECKYYC